MLRPKYWHHKGWRYNRPSMQPNTPPQEPQQTPPEPQYQAGNQPPQPPVAAPTPPQISSNDALQNVDNPLGVMQPGERVVCHITRHPFGLIGMYFITAFLFVAVFAAAALVPHYVTDLTSQDKLYLFAGAVLIGLIILLFMYIARVIYNGNRWIVTSDSITQVTQTGLFNKQSSQLSLGNLEDVTFEQGSLIQTMFGFGTLHVETAGERSKFVFPFCPKPQQCAREIIQAHEEYMANNPEGATRDNTAINRPGGVNINTVA